MHAVADLSLTTDYADLFSTGDHEGALRLARAEFTRYLGWHHANTMSGRLERAIADGFPAPANLDMIDMRALSELLFVRMKCMDRLGQQGVFADELARLRSASSHPDWPCIHTYVTAFTFDALLGRRDEAAAMMTGLGDWRTIRYSEVLEYLMDAAGDELGIGDSLELATRIVELTKSPESRFQYRLLRAQLFVGIGDASSASVMVEEATTEYRVRLQANEATPYGKMWFAEALLMRDRLLDTAEGALLARSLAFEILRDEEFTPSGKARLFLLLGSTFQLEGKPEIALNYFDLAYRQAGDIVGLFKKLHLLIEEHRVGEISAVADQVRAMPDLSAGYALELCEIEARAAAVGGDLNRLRALLGEVEGLSHLPPVLEPGRRDLRLGLMEILLAADGDAAIVPVPAVVASDVVREPPPPDAKLSWLERLNRYAHLKPSISGVGVNLNAIIDDILSKRRHHG